MKYITPIAEDHGVELLWEGPTFKATWFFDHVTRLMAAKFASVLTSSARFSTQIVNVLLTSYICKITQKKENTQLLNTFIRNAL